MFLVGACLNIYGRSFVEGLVLVQSVEGGDRPVVGGSEHSPSRAR